MDRDDLLNLRKSIREEIKGITHNYRKLMKTIKIQAEKSRNEKINRTIDRFIKQKLQGMFLEQAHIKFPRKFEQFLRAEEKVCEIVRKGKAITPHPFEVMEYSAMTFHAYLTAIPILIKKIRFYQDKIRRLKKGESNGLS
jgi:hypothetical protein